MQLKFMQRAQEKVTLRAPPGPLPSARGARSRGAPPRAPGVGRPFPFESRRPSPVPPPTPPQRELERVRKEQLRQQHHEGGGAHQR